MNENTTYNIPLSNYLYYHISQRALSFWSCQRDSTWEIYP